MSCDCYENIRKHINTAPDNIPNIAAKRVILELAKPVVQLWLVALGKTRDAIMRLLQISEEASRQSGLVSGIASTGAAAGVFLAVFALMLLIRLIM